MLDTLTKRSRLAATVASLFLIFSIMGCASNLALKRAERTTNTEAVDSTKTIDNISTDDTLEALNVVINGNHELTYTSIKQPSPPGVILYFPGTALRVKKTEVRVDNDIINNITAAELIKDGPSKIFIGLKEDMPYQINQQDNNLIISFKKQQMGVPQASVSNVGGQTEASSDAAILQDEATSSQALSETDLNHTAVETAEVSIDELPIGTRLDSVETTKYEDGVGIHLISDGAIKNYKQFTIENPARIVFDIPNIESPYKGQQIINLDKNKWVKRVRHYSHPDKIRVVLDTDEIYLSEYSAKPVETGLLVQVGRTLEATAKEKAVNTSEVMLTEAIEQKNTENKENSIQIQDMESPVQKDVPVSFQAEAYEPEATSEDAGVQVINNEDPQPELLMAQADTNESEDLVDASDQNAVAGEGTVEEGTVENEESAEIADSGVETAESTPTVSNETLAVVNQIDFSGGDDGKSTIIIGTTEKIEFSLDQVKDNTLLLKLIGTKIPGFRQRPLITTRFESAVDLITPIHTPDMADDSAIEILLRESVPHVVEQKDNQILIHFEASTIPPKVADEAKLASLQDNVLDQTGALGTAPAETSEPPAAEVTEMSQSEEESAVPAEVKAEEEFQPVDTSAEPKNQPEPEAIAPSLKIPMDEMVEEAVEEKSSGQAGLYQAKKKYTGEKIVLDFYETDIKNVLRILRDISGKNFAIDDDVKGKVTLSFIKPVPWDQVLDLILKMNKLGRVYEGDIIRVANRSTLQAEEKARKDLAEIQNQLMEQKIKLEPLVTEYIPISYSDAAKDIKPRLDEIKTPRGNIGVDNRTNQIIITDVADVIKQAKMVVKKLDKITPQVIIEARIVEANTSFSRNFGTDWRATGGPNTRSELGGDYDYSVAMNNQIADPNTVLGFNFSRIAGSPFSINAKLQAMESNGQGKIISMPKISTLDNEKALISSGVEYPYKKLDDQGNTVTEWKDIAISLTVVPQVTPDNRIALQIEVQKSDIGQVINFEQSFIVKEAKTKLLVNDGDTVVIGGVIKNNISASTSGVPYLSKIPGIGFIFKNNLNSDDKEELLIFITPKIVRLEEKSSL